MEYRIEEGKLWINNQIAFEGSVNKTLNVGENLLVISYRVGPDEELIPADNVFLFNAKGEVVWRVEPLVMKGHGFFNNAWLSATGDLMLEHARGYTCRIDTKTGKILEGHFTK